jgi:hypothetical protein
MATPKLPKMTVADEATARDVDRLLDMRQSMQDGYREIDEIEDRIFTALKGSKTKRLTLPDGRSVSLKDNYALRNTAFKTCAFRRHELVVA